MSQHHDDALAMRRAVITGDVATLGAVAGQLASDRWLPLSKVEWAPHLAAVRSAARRASEATSVEAGAVALASVGSACAGCHEAVGGPKPAAALSPPAGEDEPIMFAHQAAVDDLWDGLSTPDPAAWQRGARSLAEASLGDTNKPGAEAVAARLKDLARQSTTAGDGERQALLGQLLSTCARCHRLHGVGVRAKAAVGSP